MIIEGFELPDKCPEGCPFEGDLMRNGQSSICGRCPVLCCTKYDDDFCLIEPEDYRPDWAEVWAVWFAGPMDTYPELMLSRKVDDEQSG